MYLFFFVFAFVLLQNLHNFFCNIWAPKYSAFLILAEPIVLRIAAAEKSPCLFYMICLLIQSNIAFAFW